MKIFIWKYLNSVSPNYHSGGGLTVIAKDYDSCLKELKGYTSVEITKEPDLTLSILEDAKPEVIVFPDAGCC